MRTNLTSNLRGQNHDAIIHDAVNLKEKIEALNKEIAMLLGRPGSMSDMAPKKTKSAAKVKRSKR